MNRPVLTISVAAYNVDDYLGRALDSLRKVDGIEVLIIDDGSTDSTAAIASRFADADSETFRLISKQNGGYGSTVNRAISEAKGKYFKLLDGDDWMNTEALRELIDFMTCCEADLVVMPRMTVRAEGAEMTDGSNFPYDNGETIDLKSMKQPIGHWNMAVRTDSLRGQMVPLPEHTLYTDQLFVIQTLLVSKTVCYFAEPVYYYYVGREGQSVSRESRIAHLDDLQKVNDISNELYAKRIKTATESAGEYTLRRIAIYNASLVKTYLLLKPSSENRRALMDHEMNLKKQYPDIYEAAGQLSKRLRLTRAFGYRGYWLSARITNDSWY